ncbi:hypothetical protein ACO0QE_003967 [Hanseniaspora vineae]
MTKDLESPVTSEFKVYLPFVHKYFYFRTCSELSTAVYVGVQYNKTPSVAELYSALAKVVDKHPQLGLQLFADDGADVNCYYTKTKDGMTKPDPPSRAYAAQLKMIDFSKVVSFHRELDAKSNEAVSMFLGKRFEFGASDKSFWKIDVFKDNWLVFTFDHSLLDGMSGVIVQNDLASFLNMEQNIGAATCNSVYRPQRIASSAEDLGVVNIYTKPDTKNSGAAQNPSQSSVSEKFAFDPKHIIEKNHFIDNTRYVSIPQSDLLKLIKVGKQNGGIALNSMLCALLGVASKNTFVFGEKTIPFLFAVNQREPSNLPADLLGIFIKAEHLASPVLKDTLFQANKLNLTEFLQYAADVQGLVAKAIKSKDGIENFNELALVDLLASTKGKEGKLPTDVFASSNLGAQFKAHVSGGEKSLAFTVEDAIFGQSHSFSNLLTISSISTLKGGLNMFVTYPNNRKKEGDMFVENLHSCIKALLDFEMFNSISNHSSIKWLKNKQDIDSDQVTDGSRQSDLQHKDKVDHDDLVPEDAPVARKTKKVKASLIQCLHRAKTIFKGTNAEPTIENGLTKIAKNSSQSPSFAFVYLNELSLASHLFTVSRISLSHQITSELLLGKHHNLVVPRKKSDYESLFAKKLARLKSLSELQKQTPIRRFSRAHRIAAQGRLGR